MHIYLICVLYHLFDKKILMLRDILTSSLFRNLADPHPRMRWCGSARLRKKTEDKNTKHTLESSQKYENTLLGTI
jgi:hypothetical protein